MTASSNISPASSKKNKDNFQLCENWVWSSQFDLKLLPTFMVNFGYPHNDIVICKDSTDYLDSI